MQIVTIVLLMLMIALGIISSVTDLKTGLIYNKILVVFAAAGVALDAIYYGYFVRDTTIAFLANFGFVTAVSIALFYADCFAGGDCKLAIVLAILYPSIAYFNYGESTFTLFFALAIGVLYSYIYLLCSAIMNLVSGDTRMSRKYVLENLRIFLRTFVSASVYISIVNLICAIFPFYESVIGQLAIKAICIMVATVIGRYKIMQKWYSLFGASALLTGLALWLHIFPFSRDIDNYLFIFILILCQMTIKTDIYSKVKIEGLKRGMILSTISSTMMQNSRVRGLPGLSKQGLSDRLTDKQVESIRHWADGNQISELTIVKKIPFAFFMSLGFFSYFLIWCFLNAIES